MLEWLLLMGGIVLLIVGVGSLLLRWGGRIRTGSAAGSLLTVEEKVGLAPKQGVALIRIGDSGEGLLVSVGEGGVRPIGEVDLGPRAPKKPSPPAAPWARRMRAALARWEG